MHFYDLPVPVDRSLYDEAMRQYARKVAARADAVYAIGNITYAGLSDLDLLVVTSSTRADNAQYFAAMSRLPIKYAPIFLHDPLIVPRKHTDVLRYTTHHNLRLLHGRQVFARVQYVDSAQERWCKVLEAYCTYAAFVASVRAAQGCRGRRLIAKASGLRFPLRELDELCGTQQAQAYAARVDRIREMYFRTDPLSVLMETWQMFCQAFDTLTRTLKDALRLGDEERVDDFARRFFCGRAHFELVDPQYVAQRTNAIQAYFMELQRMRIPFGHAFFREAYATGGATYRQSGMQSRAYRLRYKLERLFDAAWTH
jgi:hypothetical protein